MKLMFFRADAAFWREFKRIGREAWQCFRFQMANVLLVSLDLVIVGFICPRPVDVGIYGAASRFFPYARNVLQGTSEVAWPIIAQKNKADPAFVLFLARFNAWTLGGASGAMTVTLGPFLCWYLGKIWNPPQILVTLLAWRLLVTSLSSPTSYTMFGLGDFKTVARYAIRELAAAAILGVVLGFAWGTSGVALGFLVATVFGSLFPIVLAYAKSTGTSARSFLWQAWWRTLMAYASSYFLAWLLLASATNAIEVALVGMVAALGAVSLGVIICGIRICRAQTGSFVRPKLRQFITGI